MKSCVDKVKIDTYLNQNGDPLSLLYPALGIGWRLLRERERERTLGFCCLEIVVLVKMIF